MSAFERRDLILTKEEKSSELERMIYNSFNNIIKGKNNIFF